MKVSVNRDEIIKAFQKKEVWSYCCGEPTQKTDTFILAKALEVIAEVFEIEPRLLGADQ